PGAGAQAYQRRGPAGNLRVARSQRVRLHSVAVELLFGEYETDRARCDRRHGPPERSHRARLAGDADLGQNYGRYRSGDGAVPNCVQESYEWRNYGTRAESSAPFA